MTIAVNSKHHMWEYWHPDLLANTLDELRELGRWLCGTDDLVEDFAVLVDDVASRRPRPRFPSDTRFLGAPFERGKLPVAVWAYEARRKEPAVVSGRR